MAATGGAGLFDAARLPSDLFKRFVKGYETVKKQLKTLVTAVDRFRRRRLPPQLVIQITDRCNATCPQCGMRVSNRFDRSTLDTDAIRRLVDAAAQKGVQAISFTGGEPLLDVDRLVEMIRWAGAAGIPFIRTGTNGYMFAHPEKPGFRSRVARLAEKLADTPLRNFWISVDSAVPAVHERMRGFKGVVDGIAQALPIFHDAGIYPAANLGINRNVGGDATRRLSPSLFRSGGDYLDAFQRVYSDALQRFYRFVIDLGFTMVNTCYPMSIGATETQEGLAPVYAATAEDDIVRFAPAEKARLFQALLTTVPRFRHRVRIFSPMTSLYALWRRYAGMDSPVCGCRGGIDFFFIDSSDGLSYPCGYRGNDCRGRFEDLDLGGRVDLAADELCTCCDWECFRDPSVLFGPVHDALSSPSALLRQIRHHPQYYRIWCGDIRYYRACRLFDGRRAPDPRRLRRFAQDRAAKRPDRTRQAAIHGRQLPAA